jgi:glycosyltransferase involved in cell wall biosynthesis
VRNFATSGVERQRKDDYLSRAPACISIASQYVANGSLLFLDIAKLVVKRHPTVTFYAADRFDPSSNLRAKMLEFVHREKLDKNFEFLPHVSPPDIMQLLNRATVAISPNLAVPTQIIGLPTKLCEYMAAGLPVVASDFQSGRELLGETRSGLLVPPGDAQSFADAVCKLIENKQEAYEMGRRGIVAFRERFNWESEVSKIEELYHRLLAN